MLYRYKPNINKNSTSLRLPEKDVRFSTGLEGTLSEDLEIIGVTVLPLVKSGNIAYEKKDNYSKKTDIGSLIHIYIKNNSDKQISPQMSFNGKTACELIDRCDNTVSWANTPDTRANRKYDKERKDDRDNKDEFLDFIPLTGYIPAGYVDCYSINVCDAKLLYNGLHLEMNADGKTAAATIYGDYPYVCFTRFIWNSSTNQKYYPDRLTFYLQNDSSDDTVINSVVFYDGTEEYSHHYWTPAKEKIAAAAETGIIPAGSTFCGNISFTEPLGFKEYLVEFNVTNNGRTYSIIQKTRPLIIDFDISVGWASGDIKNDNYVKAISSLHFNTVIGAFGSDYYLKSSEFRQQYPIKIFGYNEGGQIGPEMRIENGVVSVYAVDDIHAALTFGEPQLNDRQGNFQPMRVFNKLLMYRNAPYPTNITLSHEPFFYRYAGLSDLNHYDAYRVVAPYSDAWFRYFDYASKGKYGLYWGAPLETTGDYMRTLVKMNYPNPVAAWTQGANTWNGARRFTKDDQYYYSPNPYELRIQAYENVANGAVSLYWFNINTGDLLYHLPGTIEMLHINRELSVVGDWITRQVPYFYNRTDNYDLNLNICGNCALVYIIDINYIAKKSMYCYNEMRLNSSFSFDVPSLNTDAEYLYKITKDGIIEITNIKFTGNKLTFSDDVDMTGLYMLGPKEMQNILTKNFKSITAKETYNYLDDKQLYEQLRSSGGYSETNPYLPSVYKEQSTAFFKIVYPVARVIIHPLEYLVTKTAAIYSLLKRKKQT